MESSKNELEDTVMSTKYFVHSLGLVTATVTNIPASNFFFAQNGDPRGIFCHCNQSGKLVVKGDKLAVERDYVTPPSVGEEVVLIRESYTPGTRGYTKAMMWVPVAEWENHRWVLNLNETYRAIAYDHRVNGKFTSQTKNENQLVIGKLEGILIQFPRRDHGDPLEENHSSALGELNFTYKVRWERLCPDGVWVECADPRPKINV